MSAKARLAGTFTDTITGLLAGCILLVAVAGVGMAAASPVSADPGGDGARGSRGRAATALSPGQGGEVRLVGSWHTMANGDDVVAIATDGGRVWAATASGGVVLWEEGRVVRRYLAPQDGLPCNDVRAVLRWRGVWWFGTCAGLAALHPGRDRIELVDAELPSPRVTALHADGAGRLWVGTEPHWDPNAPRDGSTGRGAWRGGGVALTSDGRTWTQPAAAATPLRNVRDIGGWRGAVYVALAPHLIWEPASGDAGDTGRWAPDGGGVGRYEAGAWTIYDSDEVPQLARAVTSVAASAGAVWFGTSGRGLVAFDGARWTGYRDCGQEGRCLPDDYVGRIAFGTDGALWIATHRFNGRGTGLTVLDHRETPADPADDAWHSYGIRDGLPAELVSAIHPAGNATVWLGAAVLDDSARRHGRGLVHLLNDRSTFEVLSTTHAGRGAPPDNVLTTAAWDAELETLWVGTDGSGLARWSSRDGWQTHTRASTAGGLASDSIADVAVAPDGAIWVATRQHELDPSGRGWIDGGLSVLRQGAWTTIDTADGLPSNHLSAVAVDAAGKVWVGSGATTFGPKEHRFRGGGVAVLDAATAAWERTFSFPTITSNNVTAIEVRGSEVWISTSYFFYVDPRPGGAQFHTGGGLSVFDGETGAWRTYTEEDGLTPALRPQGLGSNKPLLDFRSLHLFHDGRVWAGGAAYPNAEFEEGIPLDGIIDTLDATGVTSLRFAEAGPVQAFEVDRDGYVWVAAAGGLRVQVDDEWLATEREVGRLPEAPLTDVTVDGDSAWVATAGGGLARHVPPPTAAPTDPAQPTPTFARIARFSEHVYVPRALRQSLPVLEPVATESP